MSVCGCGGRQIQLSVQSQAAECNKLRSAGPGQTKNAVLGSEMTESNEPLTSVAAPPYSLRATPPSHSMPRVSRISRAPSERCQACSPARV